MENKKKRTNKNRFFVMLLALAIIVTFMVLVFGTVADLTPSYASADAGEIDILTFDINITASGDTGVLLDVVIVNYTGTSNNDIVDVTIYNSSGSFFGNNDTGSINQFRIVGGNQTTDELGAELTLKFTLNGTLTEGNTIDGLIEGIEGANVTLLPAGAADPADNTTIDILSPNYILQSPSDNQWTSNTLENIKFNVTDSGSGVNSSTIKVLASQGALQDLVCGDNGATVMCNATLNTTGVTETTDNDVTFKINASDIPDAGSDNVNNSYSLWSQIGVDKNPPAVTINSPGQYVNLTSASNLLNISITDSGSGVADTTTFFIFENSTGSRMNSSSSADVWTNIPINAGSVYNITFSVEEGLPDGTYAIYIKSNDTIGLGADNQNATEFINITIDNTAPNLSSIITPVIKGNYSDSFVINISVGDGVLVESVVFNITNSSGGINGTFTALNNVGTYWNVTLNTSTYIDGLYNITAHITDFAGNLNSTSIYTIRFDNTAPNLSSIITPVIKGNYSDSFVINISVGDGGSLVQSVVFNITNSSGGINGTFTSSNNVGTYWNITLNTSTYIDGLYNVTAYITDFAGNLNSTSIYTIRFDNTAPTNTNFYCTPNSVYTDATVTCYCEGAADAGVGISSTVFTSSPSTTTIGSFTQTCTITDILGNSYAPTTTYTVNKRPSGGNGGGSGSSAQTWSMTYTSTEDQFATGYTRTMKANERIKVRIVNDDHFIGIKSVTSTSAVIEIASDPITVELDIGEDAKIDVNNDGIYDLYVILNNIVNGKAEITITKIAEEVPEGVEEPVATTGEIVPPEGTTVDGELKKDSNMVWIIVGILVLLIIVGIIYKKKKK